MQGRLLMTPLTSPNRSIAQPFKRHRHDRKPPTQDTDGGAVRGTGHRRGPRLQAERGGRRHESRNHGRVKSTTTYLSAMYFCQPSTERQDELVNYLAPWLAKSMVQGPRYNGGHLTAAAPPQHPDPHRLNSRTFAVAADSQKRGGDDRLATGASLLPGRDRPTIQNTRQRRHPLMIATIRLNCLASRRAQSPPRLILEAFSKTYTGGCRAPPHHRTTPSSQSPTSLPLVVAGHRLVVIGPRADRVVGGARVQHTEPTVWMPVGSACHGGGT